MKEWGLVLEGGGAKGAYQVGAYFALMEMGFNFSKIVGTSIGAFNGAMFSQGDAFRCFNLWKNLDFESFEDEVKEAEENEALLDKIVQKLKDHDIKIPEIKKSPYPLFRLVDKYIDEDKLRNSSIDFGLCTVNVSDFKVEKLFKEDIEEGLLKDYIIASCYLPLFKMKPLHGKYFLDGGFASQAPIDMIDKSKMDAVVIRLHNSPPRNEIKAKYIIKPNKKLGSSMDFNREKSDELIKVGYFDAFREVKGLKGEYYYIKPVSEEDSLKYIYRILKDRFESSESEVVRKIFEEHAPKVAEEFDLPDNFKYDELLYRLLEREGERKNLDRFKIYSVEDFMKELENGF